MRYDTLVISAHPDDAEAQMGGTLAILSGKGQRVLLVDLTNGVKSQLFSPHCLTGESYLDSRECLMGNLTFQEISDPLTQRRVIRLWIAYPPKLFSANNDSQK